MEVNSIISDDQYLDYSNSVDLMIEEMREAYASRGLPFDISIQNIPRVWSNPKFLIGHNILDPQLIFVSSFGMKLYEINTPLNGQKNYAISGFTINNGKESSRPQLILRIEDDQKIKLPHYDQKIQEMPTYCHMIKTYASALKGDIYEKEETIGESNMIENDIFICKPKDELPSDEVYSYFLAKVMDLDISCIIPDWKVVNHKAIKMLEQDNINIENILQGLSLRIIPSHIRNDGNCFYDSIIVAIHNSTTRTPNADITIEMEQKLIDNR